jgi:hypothetical protein
VHLHTARVASAWSRLWVLAQHQHALLFAKQVRVALSYLLPASSRGLARVDVVTGRALERGCGFSSVQET